MDIATILRNISVFFTILIIVAIMLAVQAIIAGGLIWVAFWLLRLVFSDIPELSFIQAALVGVALSLLSGFFFSSKTKF